VEENISVEQPTKFSMIPEWLLDINISARAYQVYGALAKYASNSTKETFVSQQTLAERLNCARSTIQAAVVELKEKGCIVVQERYDETGHQKSNNYILQWQPPAYYKGNTFEDVKKKEIVEDTGFSLDSSLDIKKPKTIVIDDIWKPLIDVCGFDPKEKTKMYGSWKEAVKLLKEKNATPDDIYEKSRKYRLRFPDAELTPHALEKWWEALDSVQPNSTTFAVSELEKRKQEIRSNKTS
jgi:predicted transcriptional regulator